MNYYQWQERQPEGNLIGVADFMAAMDGLPPLTGMNVNLRHAVDALVTTDDWTLTGHGDDWATVIYIHAGPGEAREIRMTVRMVDVS